jgi:hypothetical protein
MGKMYKEDFHKLYTSSNVTGVTKLRRKKWKGQLARLNLRALWARMQMELVQDWAEHRAYVLALFHHWILLSDRANYLWKGLVYFMEMKYTVMIHVNSSVFVKGYRCPQHHLFIPLSVKFRFIVQSQKFPERNRIHDPVHGNNLICVCVVK